MPPSPDSSWYDYNFSPKVPFDEMETDENDEYDDYEPWTEFKHFRPDGSCECLDKKNGTKCLAKKSKYTSDMI